MSCSSNLPERKRKRWRKDRTGLFSPFDSEQVLLRGYKRSDIYVKQQGGRQRERDTQDNNDILDIILVRRTLSNYSCKHAAAIPEILRHRNFQSQHNHFAILTFSLSEILRACDIL